MNAQLSDWHIVETQDDADRHDAEQPALVPVPGHLVRPLVVLTDKLFALDHFGELARGIEMQLIGLAEPDSSCVLMGIRDATNAAAQLVKSPDGVGAEAIETDEAPPCETSNIQATKPRLTLVCRLEDKAT
jgi:hypothetical protein